MSSEFHILYENSEDLKNDKEKMKQSAKPPLLKKKKQKQSSFYHMSLRINHSAEVSRKIGRDRRMALSEVEMQKDITEMRMKTFLHTMENLLW